MVLQLGGSLEFDEALFELRDGGTPVPLEPQAFDVLRYLIHHRERVVSKEELMDQVWGDRFISETTVSSRIKQVRKALGDDGQSQRMVRTVHGRGYRFVADVAATTGAPAATGAASGSQPGPVRYTTSDGLHIAYQISGGGPLDIVLISGFISHLDIDWHDPRHAHFLDRLGTMGRLIRFDKRGTGMSDRPPGTPDLETRMHDVLAVMDAVDSERAVLFGYSEGGPMAVLMSALHPERVHSLVVYNSYAAVHEQASAQHPWARTRSEHERFADRLLATWDWEADMRLRVPDADEAMQHWWAKRMSAAATPGTVRALSEMNALVDVREVLPAVRVPTLVVHRTEDPFFRIEEARYLAERIPGAHLSELPGNAHFVTGDTDAILDVAEPFVTATPRPAQRMALAAVVHVRGRDAETASRLLEERGARSRHLDTGEMVLLFDGPATGVRAGLAALAEAPAAHLGLSIAEVAIDGGPVRGAGAHDAVDLARSAPRGELWVSATAGVLLASATVSLEAVGNRDGVRRAVSPT